MKNRFFYVFPLSIIGLIDIIGSGVDEPPPPPPQDVIIINKGST